MSELLASKLFPPYAETKLLQRPRLLELFSQNKQHSATILAAPAGYGKTALMVQFAQTTKKPLVWYQLDDYDNDPAVFVQYLVAGVRQHIPSFGQDVLHLVAQCTIASHPRLLVTAIINGLQKQAADGLIIALDDYHLITEPIVHDFVQELLTHLPTSIHIVIASRTLPSLSLSRLNLLGKITVVGPKELRFTSQEIHAFWTQNCEKLSAELLDILEQQTAGWPAALRLMANSTSGLHENFSTQDMQDIYKYLAAEVFDQQPDKVQSFLLDTSILEELTPSFCNGLRKQADSEQILDFIKKQQLFLIPLTGGSSAYRYHHLFRDFLRDRLGTKRIELLRRAGLLSLEIGELESAVEYFFAARFIEPLSGAIKRAARQAFSRGSWQTVARWLDRLPSQNVSADSWLALFKAKVEICQGRLDDAQAWTDTATDLFVAADEQNGLTEIQLLQARILRCRDRYCESMEILDQIDRKLEVESMQRFEIILEKSLCLFMLGEFDKAEVILNTALKLAKQFGDNWGITHLKEALGHIYYSQGKYAQALQMYKKAADTAPEKNLPSYYMQDAVSIIYHDWGEWDIAFDYAKRNIELKVNFGLTEALPSAYTQLAGLYSDHKQWDLAEKYFQQAIDLIRKNNGERYTLAINLVFLAECLSLQGRWTEAKLRAEEALTVAQPQCGLALTICQEVSAVVFLLIGNIREGQKLLDTAITNCERMSFKKGLCYAYSFKAWHHLTTEEPTLARKYAGKALELIAELNYQQIFLGRYTMLRPLLKLGLEIGTEVTFIQRVLVRLGEKTIMYLTDLAVHGDPEIRLRTITPLAEIGTEKAQAALRLLIDDSDLEVRKAARTAAERLGILPINKNPNNLIPLRIMVFGPFQAVLTGTKDSMMEWRTNKTRDLLAYFIHQHEPVSKEKILQDLWPEVDQESATAIFHTTLYYLRHSLTDIGCQELIRYRGKRYQAQPGSFISESQEFQQMLATGLHNKTASDAAATILEAAVSLYRGDYLENIDYHWTISYREKLKQSHIDARMHLAHYYLESQDYFQAINHLHIIEKYDPFMEEAYILLMTIYAHQGNRAAIEKQYQQVTHVFKKDLGLSPSRTLQDVYVKLTK